MGKLRPNMVMLGFKSNWQSCEPEEIFDYFNVIQYVFLYTYMFNNL